MVIHTPIDPDQLELDLSPHFPIQVNDLVVFPSASGKWYHTRKVVRIEDGVLVTKNLHGAFGYGAETVTVLATNVVEHYIHPSNMSAENRELMDVNIYEHSVAETAKAKVRELEAGVRAGELLRQGLSTLLKAAEATIARVEALPDKWRNKAAERTQHAYDCADELQAALKGEPK